MNLPFFLLALRFWLTEFLLLNELVTPSHQPSYIHAEQSSSLICLPLRTPFDPMALLTRLCRWRVTTFMIYAAAITQAGTTMWCLSYNWKRTETLVLAFSLTALQTLFSSLLVALFWLQFGGCGDREHIDAVTGRSNVREQLPM